LTSRKRRYLFVVPLVLVVCALLGGLLGGSAASAAAADDAEAAVQENLRSLTKVYSAIEQNFANPVDPEKAIYQGAIQGMLRTLDPHSNFVDPKTYQLLREERRGRYYGVGMQVGPRDGKVLVIVPFVGSPAHQAGLRPGDTIVRVNDTSTEGLSTTEVVTLLKGPKGTKVRVFVKREGKDQPLEFEIVRDEIPRFSIEHAYEIRPGIGYIQISTFMETTSRELAASLRKLNPKNLKGLILDLRSNPGGLLNEAVSVSDMFLPKGQVVVSQRGRAAGERVYRATRGNGGVEYPLVVLIDRRSASASEIVAGALQDHDRALVAGETSFGKGLVQNEYPLSENSGLLLTVARYYTPSGRLIQRNFEGLSLYGYYFQRGEGSNGNGNRQIRMTDTGRTVYGGGGITPDEKISPAKLTPFMRTLEFRHFAFFGFAQFYLASRDTIPRDFQVDGAVLAEFRRYLDREKVEYTEDDLQENLETIRQRIRQDLFVSVFGKIEGDRAGIESDPQITIAIELLPRAKELAANARRPVAQQVER